MTITELNVVFRFLLDFVIISWGVGGWLNEVQTHCFAYIQTNCNEFHRIKNAVQIT